MGYLMSEKGIGPTEEKVKAIDNTGERKTASEVKSFFGLVDLLMQQEETGAMN